MQGKQIKYDGDPKTYIVVGNQDFYCSMTDYNNDTEHIATSFFDGSQLQIYDLPSKAIVGYAVALSGVWCDR